MIFQLNLVKKQLNKNNNNRNNKNNKKYWLKYHHKMKKDSIKKNNRNNMRNRNRNRNKKLTINKIKEYIYDLYTFVNCLLFLLQIIILIKLIICRYIKYYMDYKTVATIGTSFIAGVLCTGIAYKLLNSNKNPNQNHTNTH